MHFLDPLVLLALVALAAAVIGYVVFAVRSSRRASAFANPALMANIAPSSPRWRRHLPLAIYALALAALIVAVAKPTKTIAVPDERASIMLVTDVSGSMTATDIKPSRIEAARAAAQRFAADTPQQIRIGVMEFNENPRTLQAPTRDRALVKAALDKMTPSGGTATGEALKAALQVLRPQLKQGEKAAPAAIVLLSDGKSIKGRDPIEVAKEAAKTKVPIYTVTLGTQTGTIQVKKRDGSTETQAVPPDTETLKSIATSSGGEAFNATDADQLATVYDRLGSQLGKKKEKREITVWFVGGALILFGFGAASSLTLFGRLV
jgi:Ca-activated chloride channel family protein